MASFLETQFNVVQHLDGKLDNNFFGFTSNFTTLHFFWTAAFATLSSNITCPSLGSLHPKSLCTNSNSCN